MKLILLAAVVALTLTAAQAAEEAPPSGTVRVSVAQLKTQTVHSTIGGYGTVMPDADALVSVSYAKSGQVARILVRPGQSVTKGMGIAEFTTDAAAAAGYKRAASAVTFASGEAERTRALLAQHLVTNSQMAAAEQALRDAEANLEAERVTGTGKGIETLTAPFDGYIDSLIVTLGDRIQPGSPIVRLGRGAGVKIIAGIEPSDAEAVEIGQAAEAAPLLGKNAPLNGKVVGIAGMLNPVTKLVDVTIALDSGSGGFPGTPVRAAVVTAEHQGLVVPRQAVLEDEDGAYLFQVKDGKAIRVAVEMGVETDSETEVSGEKLAVNLPVVVLGNYELADGAKVSVSAPGGAEK